LCHNEGGSYYPSHGYPEPSLRARTSASARYPNWYAPLEWYISYGVDQAERAVEWIGRLEHQMDDFAHMPTEVRNHVQKRVPECLILRNHSIIFSLIDFKEEAK
jgi:hypothetical protein